MKKHILYTSLLLIFLSATAFAQRKSKDGLVQSDTLRKGKSLQFVGLPIAFYTPETEFGFGGGAQLFFLNKRDEYNNRLSNIFLSAIYTSQRQFILAITPQIYLGKGDYFIDMFYTYRVYPNFFWGIGPTTPESNKESYNETTNKFDIKLLKRIPGNLNFGLSVNYANHDITEVMEGGILDSGTVPGSAGAIISGLGALFNLDSRDDIGAPQSGNYLSLSARFSSELFGATYDFNKFILDLRRYQPIGKKSILAFRVYMENNYGDVPFQGMASYGGSKNARGYFNGRFIDKQMYIIQAEYRWRFKKRWTLAAFGLFGSVNDQGGDLFSFNNMKPSFGGGVRFKVLKNQSTWLRIDYGKGIDGQSGIYFGVNEAF
ncbi:BamA/TamA family outer membrane protein [Eudoraea sp.]|uniref:BamA/TamA family outer membrane protein n=1 Tax=Eudoraea sp. TaxID=1979955 RepID=UPI003C74FD7A